MTADSVGAQLCVGEPLAATVEALTFERVEAVT